MHKEKANRITVHDVCELTSVHRNKTQYSRARNRRKRTDYFARKLLTVSLPTQLSSDLQRMAAVATSFPANLYVSQWGGSPEPACMPWKTNPSPHNKSQQYFTNHPSDFTSVTKAPTQWLHLRIEGWIGVWGQKQCKHVCLFVCLLGTS